jgi:hypothetical protein
VGLGARVGVGRGGVGLERGYRQGRVLDGFGGEGRRKGHFLSSFELLLYPVQHLLAALPFLLLLLKVAMEVVEGGRRVEGGGGGVQVHGWRRRGRGGKRIRRINS